MRLKGKIALVTGAAQGIGAAIARAFVQEGASVILSDIDDAKGSALAEELGADYFHLDASNENDWDQFAKMHPQIDILVNNAGISGVEATDAPMNPEECSLENWARIHKANLDSVFFGCRTGIRLMKKNGGSIINLSSRSGMVGVPALAPYASSKAAIRNHTKTVALYCAQKNYHIRCNSIHPASILTPMWEKLLGKESDRESNMKKIAETIPLKRFGQPMEVAYIAVYLASDESKFTTGSEIVIDGGILAGSAALPSKD